MDSGGRADLPQAPEDAARQKRVKDGKSARSTSVCCPGCGSSETVPCFIEALENTRHYGKQRLCLRCKTIFTPSLEKVYKH